MKPSIFVAILIAALAGGSLGALLVEKNLLSLALLNDTAPIHSPPTSNSDTIVRTQPTQSYASAVEQAANAVVSIYTSESLGATPSSDQDYEDFYAEINPDASGIGSGVIISTSGLIITNYHVIRGSGKVFIGTPRSQHYLATVIGSDPETDLALLQADLTNPQPITFADSDSIRNGDVVLAIGNPFGVGKTVTMGIVSAIGRKDVGLSTYERFIQTDAAINPGNSGGALVNTQGQLVGINTAIVSNSGSFQGIAFAVPSNQVKSIIDLLQKHGRVVRGWLGVSIQTARIQAENRSYAEVVGLFKNSPAERAGLAPGDLILSINDDAVSDASDAIELIALIAPGSPIRMTIARDGETLTLTATSAERPSIAK